MRCTVDGAALADAAAWAARSLPARPVVPVLAGMLLQAGGDELRVSCFDYELATSATAPAAVSEPGRVLVSGRLLAEIVKHLPPAPVRISVDATALRLIADDTTFTLATLPAVDFPALPAAPPRIGAVDSTLLSRAVRQVTLAASREDTLPVLAAAFLAVDGEELRLICTDRYRIAVRELPWRPVAPGGAAAMLVPARTLTAVTRLLPAGVPVSIGFAAGTVGLDCDGRSATVRLLDGRPVDCLSRFPTETTAYAEVDTAALIESVRRVALVTDRTRPVELSFSGGRVRVAAGQGTDAYAVTGLNAEFHGDELTIAFNAAFLLDGLTAVETEAVRLAFTGSRLPAVITSCPAGALRYLVGSVSVRPDR